MCQEPGSSPLTRGAPANRGIWPTKSRLIPAHAGSTFPTFHASLHFSAHPRSRGEHTAFGGRVLSLQGSSPLTRGAPPGRLARSMLRRLIPAHAGSTPTARTSVTTSRAHPRSRGEHVVTPQRGRAHRGSSPLTRGAPFPRSMRHFTFRLIPAHAGSTPVSPRNKARTGAHPRSRGENVVGAWCRAGREGSSPLTRGAPELDLHNGRGRGLIPAHAGSTPRCR